MRPDDKTAIDQKQPARTPNTKAMGKPKPPPPSKPKITRILILRCTPGARRHSPVRAVDVLPLPQDKKEFPPLRVDSPPPARQSKAGANKKKYKEI